MDVAHSLQHVTRAAVEFDPPRLALVLPTERTTSLEPPDPSLVALREAALPLVSDERAPATGAVEAYLRALPRALGAGCVLGWDRDRLTASAAVERTVVLANLATLRTREARTMRDGKARATAFSVAAGLWEAVRAQHDALGPGDSWDDAGTWPATATRAYAHHQAQVCATLARLGMYAACRGITAIPDAVVNGPLVRAISKAWVDGAPTRDAPEALALSALLCAAVKAHHAAELLAGPHVHRLGHAVHLLGEAVNVCVGILEKLEPGARPAHEQRLRHKRKLEAAVGGRTARHPVRDSVPADSARNIYDEWDVAEHAVDALYAALKRDYDALEAENRVVIQDLVEAPPADAQPATAYLTQAPYYAQPSPPDATLLAPAVVAAPSLRPEPRPRATPPGLRLVGGPAFGARAPSPPPADALAALPADVRAYVRALEALIVRLPAAERDLLAATATHEARPFYAALGTAPPAWVREVDPQ